jgi:uncharacterized cupin superfamily protein
MELGITLGAFSADPEPAAAQLVHVNARQKLTSMLSLVSIEALRPTDGVGMPEPNLFSMAPGSHSRTFPTAGAGENFALVVEGAVTLRLGDEVHGLRPGDAITFAAAIPH